LIARRTFMKVGMRWAVMVTLVMAAGCGDAPNAPRSSGEEFVGTWVATNDPRAVMHIEKVQDAFVLSFEGSAQGHGFGRDQATGLFGDGVLEVKRSGLQFTFVLNADSGELVTGFKPATFRRKRPGEVPPPVEPPKLPKL
jgi:hypothetical protein